MWRDVLYEFWGFVVELDGRIGHSSVKDRARDLDRDLDAAVEEALRTVRVGYAQVFERRLSDRRQDRGAAEQAGLARGRPSLPEVRSQR